MSAMSAIHGNIWEFIENPRLDEINEPIGDFFVQFERYMNRPTKREFVLVSYYKNEIFQHGMSEQYWLDEFHAIYRG